ncbi:MAG: glycosyltransferase [Verrucomicrobia bacterium]|nr:glycosyltransferase [Verrucomicrobiota bacterium]
MSGLIAALLLLLYWLATSALVMRGNRRLRRLAALSAPAPVSWPKVSLVFAARNEGATVGAAVPTMLALDYPDYEVIAVDDRSEDDTGARLAAFAAREPRLQIEHVRSLPPGWLGKNHALHRGAARATGDWILFTDADIHFEPDALRRAVAQAEADRLDLLAAAPRLHEHGPLLGAGVNAFSLFFTLGILPWRIVDPRSAAHGSVGAFGLVRAAKYRELGGHEPIRLRPDDDVKLGKLFKKSGARCELMLGAGAIAVAWYDTVPAMVRGLTKNAYPGVDYRWWVPPLVAAWVLAFFLWPWAALLVASGPAWWCYLGSLALMLWLAVDQTKFSGGRVLHGLLLPFGAAVFGYILLRSMIVTHATGGITWRGTHYPLAELQANRV